MNQNELELGMSKIEEEEHEVNDSCLKDIKIITESNKVFKKTNNDSSRDKC